MQLERKLLNVLRKKGLRINSAWDTNPINGKRFKVYSYGGKPGSWKEIPGNKNTQFLSIYGMEHSTYLKFGFH